MALSTLQFVGLSIAKNYTLLSTNKVLNKATGAVLPAAKVLPQIKNIATPVSVPKPTTVPIPRFVDIKKEVEVVVGIDKKQIDLTLSTTNGPIDPQNGFLIEVFSSGSDGKLTKLFREDLVDVINDDMLSEGFSRFLILKVDRR